MTKETIAVLGGTGPQGKGLAYRFAKHGYPVIIGSRDPARGADTVEVIRGRLEAEAQLSAETNVEAAKQADVVLIAVPYAGHAALLEEVAAAVAGKVVIDCVNPLAFDKKGPYSPEIEDRSAAEEAQRLAPDALVTGAFHNVSAVNLWSEADYLGDEDVVVTGDSAEAKNVVTRLVATVVGRDGIDGGALRISRYVEPLTAMIISINKKYKVHAGLRISGMTK